MKKSILIVLVATLAFILPAQAEVNFGFGLGTTFNKVSYNHELSEHFKASNRMGFYVGPKVNINFLGLGAEGGVYYNYRQEELEEGYSKTFQSIEVPISVKYSFGLSRVASIYVATGPQFGFNLGAKDWNKINANDTKEAFHRDNMVVSWNIGGGVRFLNHYEVALIYNAMLTKLGEYRGELNKKEAVNNHFKSSAVNMQLTYYF